MVSFEGESEKKRCLRESTYYGGSALLPQQILPFSNYNKKTDPKNFPTVTAHGPFDLTIVENIPVECTEQEIWTMKIDGLTEVKLMNVNEKLDSKHTTSKLKYRTEAENSGLQFGYFYFKNPDFRRQFDKACAEKTMAFGENRFMSKSFNPRERHSMIANYKYKETATF